MSELVEVSHNVFRRRDDAEDEGAVIVDAGCDECPFWSTRVGCRIADGAEFMNGMCPLPIVVCREVEI